MSFVKNVRKWVGGVVSDDVSAETYEERRFREYVRALNNPVILPPDEWIDPYAITWEGKGSPTGKGGRKEGYQ